jgi:hypothetical protein
VPLEERDKPAHRLDTPLREPCVLLLTVVSMFTSAASRRADREALPANALSCDHHDQSALQFRENGCRLSAWN